jgi:tripartite-type tricarboxylate transporter receptor subunit TctC
MRKILIAIFFILWHPFSVAAEKPLIIYTSFPVGSGPDAFVRKVGDSIAKITQSPVIVENRPGGSGAVGLNTFNSIPANGQTLFFTSLDLVPTIPMIYGRDDLVKNLKLISPGFTTQLVLISSPSVQNIQDLKLLVKKRPFYGSWSNGSTAHLLGEQFSKSLDIKSNHVAYKEFNQWFIDIGNEQLAFSFGTIASSKPLMDAGKIKYLAVVSPKRDSRYPELPTLDEFVNEKISFSAPATGAAFYIHQKTSISDERKLKNILTKALMSDEVKQKTTFLNYEPWDFNEKEFVKTLEKNNVLYVQLLEKLDINLRQ